MKLPLALIVKFRYDLDVAELDRDGLTDSFKADLNALEATGDVLAWHRCTDPAVQMIRADQSMRSQPMIRFNKNFKFKILFTDRINVVDIINSKIFC